MKIYLVVEYVDMGYFVEEAFFDKDKAQKIVDQNKTDREIANLLSKEFEQLPEIVEHLYQYRQGNYNHVCAMSDADECKWFADRGCYNRYPPVFDLEEIEVKE